ncbi:MAG TPA: hypothetical protein VLA72_21640 [Anaerolineales bacterium]|nr:hypothetical protein [Anaerolineales bacterium]
MPRKITLSRSFMVALSTVIFILGFIITPYWLTPQSITKSSLFLSLTIAIGIAWVYLSINSLEIQFNSKGIFGGGLIILGVIALNYRPLNSVIPFKGDEGFHIDRTLGLINTIPIVWISGVILLLLFLLYIAIHKSRLAIFIGILAITGLILLLLNRNPFGELINHPLFFLRYPFINYWLFALVPKLVSLFASPYQEILFRIVPILSMSFLVLGFQKRTLNSDVLLSTALALSAATIPIVFYYSSILYIEPLVILLMTIICLDIKNLTNQNGTELLKNSNWYALVLIGFIKETAIPFLICFLACRWIIQLQKRFEIEHAWKSLASFLVVELKIIFSVLAPVFLYLYFRNDLTSTRNYFPHLPNLFDPTLYTFIWRSLAEQFGLYILFFLAGCILLIIKREYLLLLCYLSIIVITLAFFIMDDKAFIGYSRFNLYILPPILAVTSFFIDWVFLQKRTIGILLIISALFVNLLISPVNFDGTKKAYWGNYMIDTSEHYYPYQDAFIWLMNNYKNERVLFTGLDFQYSFQFYWNKLGWKPRRDGLKTENSSDESTAVSKILDKADREGFDFVVYRVLEENFIQSQEIGKFQSITIKNSAHTLIIYFKKP